MKSEELNELIGQGYTPYAVMKGAKSMVKLSDNRDIVTDREDNGIPSQHSNYTLQQQLKMMTQETC